MAAGVWNDAGSIAADYMMTGVPRIAGQPPGTPDTGPRRWNVIGIVATVLGVVLFAWFVRRGRPGGNLDGLGQVGWGLVAIIALAGLRFAMRAVAWTPVPRTSARAAVSERRLPPWSPATRSATSRPSDSSPANRPRSRSCATACRSARR